MIGCGYADSSEGQIHYRVAGPEDAPIIAFFHQTSSSGVMREKVLERLADRHRCYAFETPGFGRSNRTTSPT